MNPEKKETEAGQPDDAANCFLGCTCSSLDIDEYEGDFDSAAQERTAREILDPEQKG